MEPRDALRLWLVNTPDAAKLTGLSVHTIRAIRDGKRTRIHPTTRALIVAAMRTHSQRVADAADVLADPAPPSPRKRPRAADPPATGEDR